MPKERTKRWTWDGTSYVHQQRENQLRSSHLSQEEIAEAHRIELAAKEISGKALDGQNLPEFPTDPNVNQIFDFGRPIQVEIPTEVAPARDTRKSRELQRILDSHKLRK